MPVHLGTPHGIKIPCGVTAWYRHKFPGIRRSEDGRARHGRANGTSQIHFACSWTSRSSSKRVPPMQAGIFRDFMGDARASIPNLMILGHFWTSMPLAQRIDRFPFRFHRVSVLLQGHAFGGLFRVSRSLGVCRSSSCAKSTNTCVVGSSKLGLSGYDVRIADSSDWSGFRAHVEGFARRVWDVG